MTDGPLPADALYRPLYPEDRDQGDPYVLAAPGDAGARFRYYVYTTGQDDDGMAFPVYGSDDLVAWRALGHALTMAASGAHWAPCVRHIPELPRPYVMLYSRSVGSGDEAHVGHTIHRADSADPEGPFVDSGHTLTPDLDFAIDPDVYRLPDGSLRVAFAMDFVAEEPYGTGIVEAPISDDLTRITGPARTLARPSHDWQVYDPERVMPWKAIPGVDWSRDTVRWSTIEGPVGGLVAADGSPLYLYSGGCFFGYYAVGAVIERDGRLLDVSDREATMVVHPEPERGFHGPGHCSWLRTDNGVDYLVAHARFGFPDAPRQMCLVPLDVRT